MSIPVTKVLRNRFNIRSAAKFGYEERLYTTNRAARAHYAAYVPKGQVIGAALERSAIAIANAGPPCALAQRLQ